LLTNMRKSIAYMAVLFSVLIQGCSYGEQRPNILLILADDMGYSDLGCYGGEIRTPHLDHLAANGIRFTQFYNTARCSPTRASLLTGLYPHEAGIGLLTGRNMGAGYQGYINESCVTIPEVLSEAGYFTGMAGKWHAGNLRVAWPENRGFQRFFGIHNYVDSYFKVLGNCEVFEDGKILIPETEFPQLGGDPAREWYTTDVFTNKAIQFMDEALEQDKPFFQYVAFNAPHWPLEAPDDVIAEYLDMYGDGYEALRREKYRRMTEMGLVSEDWDLPAQATPDWEQLGDSAKLNTQFRRAIYAAQVDVMDQNIGKLVSHLEKRNILDKTVIIFLSDNGCSAEPQEDIFGWSWEENSRWNYPDWRRNSAREGASQGLVWSCASNAPFRMFKRYTHEGGISTPLIIHWPDGIKNRGGWDDKPGHLVDIMATCLELGETEYPDSFNSHQIKTLRGISLVKNLKGEAGDPHPALYWEHEGHGAIRMGKWKLVALHAKDDDSWELYDLEKNRTETRNLAQELPDKVAEMLKLWKVWAAETNVLPWPDRENSPRNPVEK
jgi:arylsulfatase A-like enzyme